MNTAPNWRWVAHSEPPAAHAVVAWGAAIPRLLKRLRELPEARKAKLTATAGANVLIACGDTNDLPWAEGVFYATTCPNAPSLWLPTLWQPDAPIDLLARALVRHHGRQPLLLWPDPLAVVPLDRRLPLSPALLARLGEVATPPP